MNRTRVTRPRVEYRVKAKSSHKFDESNQSYSTPSQIQLINGQKHKYFGSTRLVIVIIIQNIGIQLEVESNIRPLFDLLFDPEYWPNKIFISNSKARSSYLPNLGEAKKVLCTRPLCRYEFFLKIILQFSLGKTAARLALKIVLKSLNIGPGLVIICMFRFL